MCRHKCMTGTYIWNTIQQDGACHWGEVVFLQRRVPTHACHATRWGCYSSNNSPSIIFGKGASMHYQPLTQGDWCYIVNDLLYVHQVILCTKCRQKQYNNTYIIQSVSGGRCICTVRHWLVHVYTTQNNTHITPLFTSDQQQSGADLGLKVWYFFAVSTVLQPFLQERVSGIHARWEKSGPLERDVHPPHTHTHHTNIRIHTYTLTYLSHTLTHTPTPTNSQNPALLKLYSSSSMCWMYTLWTWDWLTAAVVSAALETAEQSALPWSMQQVGCGRVRKTLLSTSIV